MVQNHQMAVQGQADGRAGRLPHPDAERNNYG